MDQRDPKRGSFLSKYIVIVIIIMQFHEKEIQRMIHACQYYGSMIRSQDKELGEKYDDVVHKLHNYEQEMDCPDCWDPDSTCIIH